MGGIEHRNWAFPSPPSSKSLAFSIVDECAVRGWPSSPGSHGHLGHTVVDALKLPISSVRRQRQRSRPWRGFISKYSTKEHATMPFTTQSSASGATSFCGTPTSSDRACHQGRTPIVILDEQWGRARAPAASSMSTALVLRGRHYHRTAPTLTPGGQPRFLFLKPPL